MRTRGCIQRWTLMTLVMLVGGALAFADPAQPPRQTAAVMELIAVNVDDDAVHGLEDVVLDALAKNERLGITDPVMGVIAYSRDRLGGESYQPLDSLISRGRELGLAVLFDGKVMRFNGIWALELRAIDVDRGKLLRIERRELDGDAGAMRKALGEMAEDLAARAVNTSGVLYITTDPEASAVAVDGQSQGIAPVRLETPGGVTYTVTAKRAGHKKESKRVRLAEGDSVHVKLRLGIISNVERNPVYMRTWVSGGWPIGQSSSTFDTRVTMKDGQSWGAAASFGGDWRIRFGGYTYTGIIRNVDRPVMESYEASGDPLSSATTFHSSMIFSASRDHFGPYIGVGLAAVKRDVTIKRFTGPEEVRETNFYGAWLIQLGVEFGITRHFGGQFELIHTNVLGGAPDMRGDEGETVHPVWNHSIDRFKAFTIFRFSLGYRL